MARHILFCQQCKKYTMQQTCSCGTATVLQRPPKYSPEDKYGKYRRQAKETIASTLAED